MQQKPSAKSLAGLITKQGPDFGRTLWGLLAAGAGPLALLLAQKFGQPQPQQAPGYYSENFMGPTPEGSLQVPAMQPGTNGMVYDPSDRWISPDAYASRWGWQGGSAPRGDY